MYLCIYKRNNKLYFNVNKKLTEKFCVTNEKMETVKLGYNNKIKSWRLNSMADFKLIIGELKQYGLRMLIMQNAFRKVTQVKFTCLLLNNPFYDIVLDEKNIESDIPENEVETQAIELKTKEDWELAEEKFDFQSDFVDNVF